MSACKICGRSLKEGARFCPGCGNPIARDEQTDQSSHESCPRCGKSIDVDTRYCPFCGNEINGPPDESDDDYVETIVDALEATLSRQGATVLIEVSAKRNGRRVEVMSDQLGRYSPHDRALLKTLLDELIYGEGYLYSNVMVDDEARHCVWHAIAGGIFSLEASHAEFVLFHFDNLSPKGVTQFPDGSVASAPSIWSTDE